MDMQRPVGFYNLTGRCTYYLYELTPVLNDRWQPGI